MFSGGKEKGELGKNGLKKISKITIISVNEYTTQIWKEGKKANCEPTGRMSWIYLMAL